MIMEKVIDLIMAVFVFGCILSVICQLYQVEKTKYYAREYIKELMYKPKSLLDEEKHFERLDSIYSNLQKNL